MQIQKFDELNNNKKQIKPTNSINDAKKQNQTNNESNSYLNENYTQIHRYNKKEEEEEAESEIKSSNFIHVFYNLKNIDRFANLNQAETLF